MKRFSFLFGLILMLVLVLVACDSSEEASGESTEKTEGFDIGFAIKTEDAPFFVSEAAHVKEYGEKEGWNVNVLDANGDINREAENIDTFVSQGKDLIFIDPIDPTAAVANISKATNAGIPVIVLDNTVDEDADNITIVYADNVENGKLVGKVYGEKMQDKEIKAILLSGEKGNLASQERRTGLFAGIIESRTDLSEEGAHEKAIEFNEQLTSQGEATFEDAKLSVVGQGWGSWTEEKGLSESEDLISANPGLTTIFGENDEMLFGARTALSNSGLDEEVDLVATADGTHKAMDLIKEGKYFATGLNSPGLIAEKGIEIAKEVLVEGKDPESYPETTITEPAAIIEENVDEYYDLGF